MNRVDLGERVAESSGLTLKQANAAVAATLDAISAALANGQEVTLHGFGSFRPKERSARTVVHPVTKERMQTSASRSVGFTPAANLRRRLEGQESGEAKGRV